MKIFLQGTEYRQIFAPFLFLPLLLSFFEGEFKKGKYLPPFNFAPLVPICKKCEQSNLRLDEFRTSFKLLFLPERVFIIHSIVWQDHLQM